MTSSGFVPARSQMYLRVVARALNVVYGPRAGLVVITPRRRGERFDTPVWIQ